MGIGIIKGRCRSRSSGDRCYRIVIQRPKKTAKVAKQEEKKTTITVGSS
ncbi:hypothetical protein AGMMS50233_10740 [Endomicrobiia bacterium]|nr:hypothetical protein AGMMS50233_10740 [Endomicrobiia bacterium]